MKAKKFYTIFLLSTALLLVIGYVVHIYKTNEFNEKTYAIDSNSKSENCTFTFLPQNGEPISWTKETELDGESVKLNACTYEGTISNSTDMEVSNWSVRLDINSDCYLNSAWCGTVEIHQFESGVENVQTLDLRNVDPEEVTINFYECGDIYLFPLTKGDYLIYHPSVESDETPVEAAGDEPQEVVTGMILYWDQESDYQVPIFHMQYQYYRGLLQGTEATVLMILTNLWILLLIIFIVVCITGHYMAKQTAIELSKKDIERKTMGRMLDELIRTLANAIDAKDKYTHGHSERVAQYSLMLAQQMNLPNEECKRVFYAGLVHDVGKIGIPEEIINKTSRLNDEEFAIIKSHPERGEKILQQIKDIPYLTIGAKYHHEKYDGSGYPSHAKGEEIPQLARIIAVADAYDAMTSQRSYRNTLDQKIVKQEIWKGIGTQFDPLVAKHMIALIDADTNYDMREKVDETYEMINNINKNEFWDDYDPKSIKAEEQIMADTEQVYFGQFVYTIDHWLNPILPMAVEREQKTMKFVSKTWEDAEFIWNVPALILYTSEDGKPDGNNYSELAVYMGAGYSWRTGDSLSEENALIRKENFGDWKNWVARNKEGLEYTLTIEQKDNAINLRLENDLIAVEGHVVLPENYDKKVYCCVTGERCDIS